MALKHFFSFSHSLERALRPNRMYWRQGIYLNWSPEAYCLVESAVFENNPNSFLKITVPSCRKGEPGFPAYLGWWEAAVRFIL